MKEFIKENWFKMMIVVGMFIYLGTLGLKEYKSMQKQKCIENCHFSVSKDKEFIEKNYSNTELLKKCSEICSYLPGSFQ